MDDLLLSLTDALIEDIKQTTAYQHLLSYHEKIENDTQIIALSQTFQKAQKAYEKARQYGSHHPDLLSVQRAYQEAKTALFEHPDVKGYQAASKALKNTLQHVSKQLANAVSNTIKTPGPLGVFTQGGSKQCSTEEV